jgi:enoyl-CoA hydratase/carnithine racemase
VSLAIYNCRKPVIGALNGSAVGVGITQTLPMAIRIAPKNAKIGFVFARRGLVMEAASSFFLPKLIGYSKAMHLITTGATYPASHPLLNDLFSETLDNPADVLPRAIELATEFVDNCSNVSWALMKDMIWRAPNTAGTAEEAHLLDSKIIYEMFGTPDNKEGVQSFLEKRKVNFKGSIEKDTPSASPWWKPVHILELPKGKLASSKL